LDKLDSIPGFKTSLPSNQIIETVQKVGCVICGQTERMVPADRVLYSLRDVTGTVPSIPLIVASILSKKLAEGLSALVLDVKFGAAAFMPKRREAKELAQAMVTLGNECRVHTRALLTNMDVPLGRAAGNWLEVKEAVACLECDRSIGNDLRELVLAFAAQLLVQTGRSKTATTGYRRAEECLESGEPRQKWDGMLAAQGADLQAFHRKLEQDHTAPVVIEFKARQTGWVARCDARTIGEIIRDLGGGRITKESRINYDVGMDRLVKPGEPVQKDSVLARVHAADEEQALTALERLRDAFIITSRKQRVAPLIAARL
jgi:pyrimidine-nucleoside phosphorylase